MRKLLLGTTAVVGAALLGATGAMAQAPAATGAQPVTVRIGGYFDFSYYYVSDNADRGALRSANNFRTPSGSDFRSDAEFFIIAEGRTAGGLTYGVNLEFQVDNVGGGNTGTGAGTTVDTDHMFVYLSTPNLGTVRLGDTDSAANLLTVRPNLTPNADRFSNLVRGGAVGDGTFNYMIAPINDGNDATKIVYLSPQFFGFDFGVSFGLNSFEGEREVTSANAAGQLQRSGTGRENHITAGIRYRGNFSGVGVALGAGYSYADAQRSTFGTVAGVTGSGTTGFTSFNQPQDIWAAQFGATVSFAGFTFGGEYMFGRYSGTSPGNSALQPGLGDSQHWLIGAHYNMAPFVIAVSYGQAEQEYFRTAPTATTRGSNRQTIEGELFQIGAGYTIAPGLLAYTLYEYQRQENIPSATGGIPAGGNRTIGQWTAGLRMAF